MKWTQLSKNKHYFVHMKAYETTNEYLGEFRSMWEKSMSTLFEVNRDFDWDVIFVDFWYDPGHIVIYPSKNELDRGKEKARIRLIVPVLVEFTTRHIAVLEKMDAGLATEEEEKQLILEQRRMEVAFAEMIYRSALDFGLPRKVKSRFGKVIRRIIAKELEPENPIAEYELVSDSAESGTENA